MWDVGAVVTVFGIVAIVFFCGYWVRRWFHFQMVKMRDTDLIDYPENDYYGDNVMFDHQNLPVDWMDRGPDK